MSSLLNPFAGGASWPWLMLIVGLIGGLLGYFGGD